MNKTISIHIKGFPFILEEDAYMILKNYITNIEINLNNNPDTKEIISDIELRIAELCQLLLTNNKQVIETEDINNILITLGSPDEFKEFNDNEINNEKIKENEHKKYDRKLYRDLEEAKIAGVCSGISNYFAIDVIFIRLIFILILFVAGFGIPLYLILWIVIPKASSNLDRLKMYGKAITIDNIKEEFETTASKIKHHSKSFIKEIKEDFMYKKRFKEIGNILRKIFSIFLLSTALILLIVFIAILFGIIGIIPIQSNIDYLALADLNKFFFNNEIEALWIYSGIFIFGFSVVLLLLSNGIYILFNIKNSWKKYLSSVLGLINFVGIVICIYAAIKISSNFSTHASLDKKVVDFNSDTLYVECLNNDSINGFKVERNGIEQVIKINSNDATIFHIPIIIKESKDTNFHVYQQFSSNGMSFVEAENKASKIKNNYIFKNNLLKINPFFSFPTNDKFRNQKIKWFIEVPHYKTLYINNRKINIEKDDFDDEKYINIYNGNYKVEWD